MNEPDKSKVTKSQFSSRVEPFWLNPATIKGTIAIVVGALILFVPEISITLLRYIAAGTFIVGGSTDLWFHLRGRTSKNRNRDLFGGLLTVLLGVVLLFLQARTVKMIMVIIGLYFIVKGTMLVIEAIRARGTPTWALSLARGLFLLVFGVIILLVPGAVLSSLVVVVAALLVVVGGIMLTYGIRRQDETDVVDVDTASVTKIIYDWVRLQDVGDTRRDEINDGLHFEQPDRTNKLVAWWVMLLLSVAIATFGILQDSTAVVIGAMLIAPLMSPIIGTASALVDGIRARVGTSLVMVAAGVGASIALAFVIGVWIPQPIPLSTNSQVVSRVNPNIIDMGIALAAGAAGAFANVNRRVSASIAGVAIAVALVPPLGVVGLTLNAGMYGDSLGSFMLFMTNFVSIILAAMIVFALTGFAPISRMQARSEEIRRVVVTIGIAALLITIPLGMTVGSAVTAASRQSDAQKAAEAWIEDAPDLGLDQVEVEDSDVAIIVSGSGEVPPLQDLEAALADAFGVPVTIEVEHIPSVVLRFSTVTGEASTRLDDG